MRVHGLWLLLIVGCGQDWTAPDDKQDGGDQLADAANPLRIDPDASNTNQDGSTMTDGSVSLSDGATSQDATVDGGARNPV